MTGPISVMIYSAFTIIYIAIVITSAIAAFSNKKNGYEILGMNVEKAIATVAISTIAYSLLTALVIENLHNVWNNFIFVICVIGAIIFAIFGATAAVKSCKEDIAIEMKRSKDIKTALSTLKQKTEDITLKIQELEKNKPSSKENPELYNRTCNTINELTKIKDKYSALISELTLQEALSEAKIDNMSLEEIGTISSKNVKTKLQENIDRYDYSKKLDNSLFEVNDLMKNYK